MHLNATKEDGMARETKSESGDLTQKSGEVKAKLTADSAGWRTEGDSKTQYGDRDDVVMLPAEEFKRLEALGAAEKAGADERLTSEGEDTGHPKSPQGAAERLSAESEEPEEETARQ